MNGLQLARAFATEELSLVSSIRFGWLQFRSDIVYIHIHKVAVHVGISGDVHCWRGNFWLFRVRRYRLRRSMFHLLHSIVKAMSTDTRKPIESRRVIAHVLLYCSECRWRILDKPLYRGVPESSCYGWSGAIRGGSHYSVHFHTRGCIRQCRTGEPKRGPRHVQAKLRITL